MFDFLIDAIHDRARDLAGFGVANKRLPQITFMHAGLRQSIAQELKREIANQLISAALLPALNRALRKNHLETMSPEEFKAFSEPAEPETKTEP